MLPWEIQAQATLQSQKIKDNVIEASPAQIMKKIPSGAAESLARSVWRGSCPGRSSPFPAERGASRGDLLQPGVFFAASAVMDEAKARTEAARACVRIAS